MKSLLSILTLLLLGGCARFHYTIKYRFVKTNGEDFTRMWTGTYEPKVSMDSGCVYFDGRRYDCDIKNWYFESYEKKKK